MSTKIKMYGISNCDTIKKAKIWLTDHAVNFEFHDYRKQGLDAALLEDWVELLGWQVLVNKRSTSWRKLSDEAQQSLDRNSAIEIMLDNPAIIKRPLIILDNKPTVGFDIETYTRLFT